jgi:hypothetical protein
MSIEEIRQNWDLCRNSNQSVNINCGSLRGIGKTQFLRQLMIDYKRNNLSSHIVLLIPNSRLERSYRDIVYPVTTQHINTQSIIDRVIVANDFELSEITRRSVAQSYVFADEVPNAEQICMYSDCTFVAGTYSNHDGLVRRLSLTGLYGVDGDRQNLRAQNLRTNRNGDALTSHSHHEAGIDFMQGLTEWQQNINSLVRAMPATQDPNQPIQVVSFSFSEPKKEIPDQKIKFKFIATV